MPRSYDSIEGDIAKARDDLAATLDEIINRANPKNFADQGKEKAVAVLKNPKVLAGIGAVVAVVAAGVTLSVVNKRKKNALIDAYLASKG